MTSPKRAKRAKPKAIWLWVAPQGYTMERHPYTLDAWAEQDGWRRVRYIPAPTRRERKAKP